MRDDTFKMLEHALGEIEDTRARVENIRASMAERLSTVVAQMETQPAFARPAVATMQGEALFYPQTLR